MRHDEALLLNPVLRHWASLPPNPPFQPTASREIVGFLTAFAARLRQLNGNPLGRVH